MFGESSGTRMQQERSLPTADYFHDSTTSQKCLFRHPSISVPARSARFRPQILRRKGASTSRSHAHLGDGVADLNTERVHLASTLNGAGVFGEQVEGQRGAVEHDIADASAADMSRLLKLHAGHDALMLGIKTAATGMPISKCCERY
jgi:hypothetical protein